MTIAEQVELLATQLLPSFIPKNSAETTLSFQFTLVPNTTYKVNFHKTEVKGKAEWLFKGFEKIME